MVFEREQPEAAIRSARREERTVTPKVLDMRLALYEPYCGCRRDAKRRWLVVGGWWLVAGGLEAGGLEDRGLWVVDCGLKGRGEYLNY